MRQPSAKVHGELVDFMVVRSPRQGLILLVLQAIRPVSMGAIILLTIVSQKGAEQQRHEILTAATLPNRVRTCEE